ncbi:hypothetical protein D3C80_986110 [compost metagenome]
MPVPALAPVTFVCTTVHVKVVPMVLNAVGTVINSPEQTEAVVRLTVGFGFTVIVTVFVGPTQPFAVGVMV